MLSATAQVEEAQRGYDSAEESLDKSEPVQAIASLHKRLSDAEERAAFHQSRNESVDLHQRLEDLRQRQLALRKQLGQVTDKRREIEPVFGELKQRQLQLEEALAEIETDDNRNSLAGRLKDVSNKVGLVQTRLKTLEELVGNAGTVQAGVRSVEDAARSVAGSRDRARGHDQRSACAPRPFG